MHYPQNGRKGLLIAPDLPTDFPEEPFFFAVLAGNAVLLGMAAFLIRTLIKHILKKERSVLLSKLQTQSAVELEHIKQVLAIDRQKNEIYESWLHQKRAEALYQLYTKAIDLRGRTESIFNPFFGPKGPGDIRSKTEEAWSLLQEFYQDVSRCRVFLSEKTYVSLSEVFSTAQYSLGGYLGDLKNYHDHELHMLKDARDENYQHVCLQLRPAVEMLLKECHRVYGVPAEVNGATSPPPT